MIRFFYFFLFCNIFSCSQINKNPKDWESIYKKELIIAKENNDAEAWLFFFPEYLKELKEY